MLKFLADEDLNNRILCGLIRRHPNIDVIRVQDTTLAGAIDVIVLEWTIQNARILLTHDVSTMTDAAYSLIRFGRTIPGIIEIPQSMPVGRAIEDILLIATTSLPDEITNQVIYLPL